MSRLREQKFQAYIVKTMPYGEGDEIITFFSREAGKIRARAKSVKQSKSKLRAALQPIFLNSVTFAGQNGLPKITGVQTEQAYPWLHAAPERINIWYVIAELLNKALSDEQKNEALFDLVYAYVNFLNAQTLAEDVLKQSLTVFKIKLMSLIGLGIHEPRDGTVPVWFSADHGGFYSGQASSDAQGVTPIMWDEYKALATASFDVLPVKGTGEIANLVNQFIRYRLEREIKADRYLT